MDIGHKIYEIRKQHGLSQEQFAEKFHVTRQTVSNWENNKNYPDLDSLKQISDEFGISFDTLLKEDHELIREIDKTRVRAKRTRIILICLAAALLVGLAIFALPEAVSKFFYDPGETVFTGQYNDDPDSKVETSRLAADVCVYSELFIPGRKYDNSRSTNLGYGNYDITLSESVYYSSGKAKPVSGKISRNHMTLYDPAMLSDPSGNAFDWTGSGNLDLSKSMTENYKLVSEMVKGKPGDPYYDPEAEPVLGMAGGHDFMKDNISDLKDNTLYTCYLSLERITDYEEAVKWCEKYDVSNMWAGIVTGKYMRKPTGMYVYTDGIQMSFDEEKYPYLFGSEFGSDKWDDLKDEDSAKQHFTSMFRYMMEQKTFIKMFRPDDEEIAIEMNSSLNYVEKNGLKVYGFSFVADKETLLKMADDRAVYTIATEEY